MIIKNKKKNKNQELPVAGGGVESVTGVKVTNTKKKRKKIRIIIAVAVVLLVVIKVVSCATSSNAGMVVTTTGAVTGDLQETISTSGTVVSGEKKVIFSRAAGRVDTVLVEAGDAVKAGDILVCYDMDGMERKLHQAALQQVKSDALYQGIISDNSKNQGKLTEANVNLDVLNRQIEDNKAYLKDLQSKLSQNQRDTLNSLSEENYDLQIKLADLQEQLSRLNTVSGGDTGTTGDSRRLELTKEIKEVNAQISRNAYLQSIANSTDYVADMEQEIANVQERIADYEEYKARMESQKSGSEGLVLDSYDRQQYSADKELADIRYAEAEDEYYAAKKGVCAEFDGIVTECSVVEGAMVENGVQMLTLESTENVIVTFNASKYDVAKLEIGQKVDVTTLSKTYEGEISKINRMATPGSSNTPMVGVQVHLLNPDENIILGLDAKLEIHTGETTNALLIPVEAVNADKNGDFLYVVENGVVARRTIVCGISSDSYTEVLEGITESDKIILTASGILEEGMAVTVLPQ